ncbi:RNA polymerase sigma factor [Phascolarctobacterium sp.]
MKINKFANLNNTDADKTRAARLQLLITAAQTGDKTALLQLCEDFKPLLQSESRREMFYKSLGRDAESIAVLAFIELVLKYKGADYLNWPGYARCKVHFALFDAMEKQGRIWENETQIDTGSDLLDSGYSAAGALDELAQLLLSLDLQTALAQLNEQQRRILLLLFINDLKPADAARHLHCTVRNITKHRLKALDRLREILKQEG